MDDRTQIRGETNAATSYGGLSVNDLETSVVISQPSTSNAAGGSHLDDAPLFFDDGTTSGRSTFIHNTISTHPSVELGNITNLNGLSTISGVFTPVTISMFSVLLFLRMGFVVGQLGFLLTVVQLLLAYMIVMLTVLSLCAISTNGAIEGGGVYYMLSRSLGPEFGGAIGLLFFTANVFSCALYISGFTEALLNNIGQGSVPSSPSWQFMCCVLVSIVLLILCLLGASIFGKSAFLTFCVISVCYCTYILSVIIVSPQDVPIPRTNEIAYLVYSNDSAVDFNQNLTCRYTGFRFSTLADNMLANYTVDYTTSKMMDFPIMFAVIFSGVTGLMAGANMSGELAKPSVSIPKGTVQAVLFTLGIYIITAFITASTCSRSLLHNDYSVMVMADVNLSPWFIFIGIFFTTFFSSMSNLIGSSRVLNRLAHDKLFGFLLHPAKIELSSGNPVISVLITWVCVVLVLLIGAVNKIAKLTSIFFLLSYMGVNIACLALELTSAPNFRPTFKYFSWQTCGLGVICTVIMMLVIDTAMSAIAVIVLMFLIMVLHYQAPAGSWGSISQALIYHQVRKYLLLLDVRKEHVKYWRPQILLLVSRPASSTPLMDFVNDLKKSGLYVIGHVKRDSVVDNAMDPLQQVTPYWLSLVDYLKLKAFVELTIAKTIRDGAQQLIRLSGLGAMKPNTVILGFHELSPPEPILAESHLLKDLKFSRIDRAEVVEYFTAADYVPCELNGNCERLSSEEYVHILNDVLHVNKNLCVARHFHRLDKESLKTWNGEKRTIDVWPVCLQKPGETGLGWGNSSLFLLQMACILSMSSRWRSCTVLRVFICVNSLQDMQRRERQLRQMLSMLRIKARSQVMPWDHVVCHLGDENPSAPPRESVDLPLPYLSGMNDLIKKNSGGAAICLLDLPVPPTDVSLSDSYLNVIRTLTEGLPPTLLVHGLSSVISTAL